MSEFRHHVTITQALRTFRDSVTDHANRPANLRQSGHAGAWSLCEVILCCHGYEHLLPMSQLSAISKLVSHVQANIIHEAALYDLVMVNPAGKQPASAVRM